MAPTFPSASSSKNMVRKTTLFFCTIKHVFSSIMKKPSFCHQTPTFFCSCPSSTSTLVALSSDGLLSEALFEMAKQGLEVKFKEYDTLLNKCISQRAIREGQRVHTHMIKTHYQPPVYLRTRLIVFYLKCELLDDARWVFDEMPERNVVSWTALISGYSQKGYVSEALHLFVQMLRSGTEPNEFTFATVLTSCIGALDYYGQDSEMARQSQKGNGKTREQRENETGESRLVQSLYLQMIYPVSSQSEAALHGFSFTALPLDGAARPTSTEFHGFHKYSLLRICKVVQKPIASFLKQHIY
ncbi:PREDICTED: pentatricopeptide repeat-containing protein At2g03880, mitochondrial-like [Nicotiana attenuata]|uniref:pentatricopeptide repeat-containing protein At2g03880, mitochondrial-like n=1 Tax=Nicotiana attenuata TaxID=49451 RepID=UPI000904F363|nr:PREDICTED: pentatricopeptide repeat-containing protein At2g03880, mitochondrial-like [Nicotiana attenuata]